MQKYSLFSKIPINLIDFCQMPLLRAGAQLQVRTKVNMSCLQGDDQYLAYDPKGETGITHKAFIAPGQND